MTQIQPGLDDPLQPVRQKATDTIVAVNRKNVPPDAVNQRTVPRMSIEELNNSSWEDVEKRYNKQRLDLRPPFVKVLDLIDLPRNTILNIAAGKPSVGSVLGTLGEGAAVGGAIGGLVGAAGGAAVAGAAELAAAVVRPFISDQTKAEFADSHETAALDQPRIMFSDVLKKAGVSNHAAAGILGFVGDVVFDPLTYAGPAGPGLRAIASGGKIAAEATKGGTRAFRSGLKAAAESGLEAVRNPEVRAVIEKSGYTADKFNELRNAGKSSEEILDELRKTTQGGAGALREGRPIRRFFGGSIADNEGTLGKYLLEPSRTLEEATAESARRAALGETISAEALMKQGEIGQAARNFFQKYGRSFGTESGSLRIKTGVDKLGRPLPGVQIAHIPFTDLNLQLPSFAGRAESALAAHALVNAKQAALQFGPDEAKIRDIAAELIHHAKQGEHDADELARLHTVEPTSIGETTAHMRASAQIAENAAIRESRVKELLGDLRTVEAEIQTKARTANIPPSAERILAMNSYREAVGAAVNRMALESVDLDSRVREAAALRTGVKARVEATAQSLVDRGYSPEHAAAKAEEIEKARLSEVQQELVDTNSETSKALNANIEARQVGIAAAFTLANATESSIVNHLTSTEKDLVALANAALGTTDFVTGASLFSAIGHSINDIVGGDSMAAEFAFRVDQRLQKEFGRRSGLFARSVRNSERMATTEMRRVYANIANDYRQRLIAAADAADVPYGKINELDSITTALAYEQRLLQGIDLAQDQRFYAEPWVNADGAKIGNVFTALEESRQSGLLKNKDLEKALTEIAQDATYLWDELGDIAVVDEYLTALRDGYVPTLLSKEANDAIRIQMKNAAFQRRSTYLAPTDVTDKLAGFQRVRMTDQVRFNRSDGKLVRFFEGDRAAVQPFLDDPAKLEQLKITDPPQYEKFADTVQTIKEYDALPADVRPPMRQTDAFELNSLIPEGRFAHLTGKADLKNGFANTSLIHLVGSRSATQQLAYARRALENNVLSAPGLTIPKETKLTQGQAVGDPITLSGGAVAKVVSPGVLEVGGKRYRALNAELFPWDNPLTSAMGAMRDQRVYEESVAERLEKAADAFQPENFGPILKAIDQTIGAWKSVTLLSPSWEIAEITGNSILAWMSGAPFHRFAAHIPDFIKLFWNERNPEALRKLSFKMAGETLDGEQMLAALSHSGVTDAGLGIESIGMMLKNGVMALPGAIKGRGWDALKVWQRAKQVEQEAKPFATAGTTGGDGLFRSFFAPWFAVNRKVNNAMRAATFMAFLDAGHDAASAAERTLHGMFDFEDLTKTDKSLRRFVLPFYSWVRSNGVYQVHSALTRPMYVATVPKVQQAIEEMLAGDDRVPQHLRPSWMREQLATQIGADPEKRWALNLGGLAPQTDAINYLQPIVGLDGIQQFLHYFAGSFNPVIKTPLEIGAHREFFSDRSIAPTVEEGDISIPEHLLGQIRPLKELGIGSNQTGPIQRGFEQGPGAGTARLLLAGRAQDFSKERTDRQLLRNFKDRETGIRQALARAQRNGRSDTALEASVQLMRLYDAMREAGFEKDIPKWARSQLDRLDAVPAG